MAARRRSSWWDEAQHDVMESGLHGGQGGLIEDAPARPRLSCPRAQSAPASHGPCMPKLQLSLFDAAAVGHDGVDVYFAAFCRAATGLVFNECNGWGCWGGQGATGSADEGDFLVCDRSGDGLSRSPPCNCMRTQCGSPWRRMCSSKTRIPDSDVVFPAKTNLSHDNLRRSRSIGISVSQR